MSYQTLFSIAISFPMWKEAVDKGLISEEGRILRPFFLIEVQEVDHGNPYGYGARWWDLLTTEEEVKSFLQKWNFCEEEGAADAWATKYVPQPNLSKDIYVHREF
jgi:hypothetical protein